jgi:perosamine synthetase
VTEDEARIPVSQPSLTGNEMRYVEDCLRSTWISSKGAYLQRFEEAFADFVGTDHAIGCNNGTAALHVALLALGIGPGDEVIVPTMTYIASANAVRYCGATPMFADSLPDTWNLDPADVERRLTPRTKAIMAVHLYGEPADMGSLAELARGASIHLLEDAAEAHGARFTGKGVGSIGTIAAFSFYGNKIITTGEGGMVTTADPELAERARLYRGQGQDPNHLYWFPVVGHNYRMTNIEAAIGLAQMEQVESKLSERARVAASYARALFGSSVRVQAHHPGGDSVAWIVGAVLPVGHDRDAVAAALAADGIETRPFFYPIHTMPPYVTEPSVSLPVAEDLALRGLCLPTWPELTEGQIARVCDRLMAALGQ